MEIKKLGALAHNHDFYAFMHASSRISSSQQEYLRHAPFVQVREDVPNYHHDTPSSVYGDFPVASDGVVMVSPSESLDGVPQDVFHTPPEESSLPSSDDQRRETIISVDGCVVNNTVDVEIGTQGFVDLGRDSQLGFSEAHLTLEMDVVECSRDRLGEIPNSQFDEFGVLERGLTDFGEPPVKRSRNSEHDSGFDSPGEGDCFGVQLQTMEEGNAQNPYKFGEDLQLPQIWARAVDRNKPSDGVVEASGMPEKNDEEQGLRALPSSIRRRLENAGSEFECGKVRETECPVFYVLKVLSQNSHEVEDDVDDASLLETAKLRGVNFPRPRWWPESDNFNQLD